MRALTKEMGDKVAGVPPNLVRRAIRQLAVAGHVTVVEGTRADRISLTEKGTDYAIEQIRGNHAAKEYWADPRAMIARYERFQYPFPKGYLQAIHGPDREAAVTAGEGEEDDDLEVPASDRTVTLDHNSPAYQDAIGQLDRIIEETRSSNTAGGDPNDRERALVELSAIRRMLEATKVRAQRVVDFAIEPLRWVAENVAKEGLREAVKQFTAWLFKALM